MKKLFKILRSIITSFLCIIIIILISIQLVFTTIKIQNKKIPDLIDREEVLNLVVENNLIKDNNVLHDIVIKYIDDYIDYIFYKRSYPTINLGEISKLNSLDKINLELDSLKSTFDLDYETVVLIRDLNNIIYNQSIYLLLNITIFAIFLIISILYRSFLNGFKIFGICLILSALIILIGSSVLYTNILSNNQIIFKIGKNVINNIYIINYLKLCVLYLIIGFTTVIITIIITKLQRK